MKFEIEKQRPNISKLLSAETFLSYYYLKEELSEFCRAEGLPANGSKEALTNRISFYLQTGRIDSSSDIANQVLQSEKKLLQKRINNCPKVNSSMSENLSESSLIEAPFICSEKHRAFFVARIGKNFSFNVAFQKWLKSNPGKTYADAINAYYEIKANAKNTKTQIDKQFEYNTYIRDFFLANKGESLESAIKCWKYKKSLPGHNKYEAEDLIAIS